MVMVLFLDKIYKLWQGPAMYSELLEACKERYGSSNSSVSLGDWMCQNTTLRKKPFSFEHYPFQKAIADDEHPNLSCEKCSQVGLALPLTTELVTPTGWTTMGEVNVGDYLFGPDGEPTLVTFKSKVFEDDKCFEIEFDDGTKEICDENHRWFVKTTRGPFNNEGVYQGKGRPKKALGYSNEGVVSTKFLLDNLDKTTFFIPNAQPINLPQKDLPIDPYVYGLWLGDGSRHSATLTVGDQDIEEITKLLFERGIEIKVSSKIQYRLIGQFKKLREMDVIGRDKRIPIDFQRASINQRNELLRGLMDSDGSITKRGRASFHNTETKLVEDVKELLHGLGYKTRTRWRSPTGEGFGGIKDIAEVSFVPNKKPVFNLQRKLERQQSQKPRTRFTDNRTIKSILPVTSVDTQCLTVDNKTHLFLMGRSMIPTHNTEVQIRKFFGLLRRNTALSGIFTLPNEKMFKRIYNARMKPIIDADAIFNPPMDIQPVRRMDLIQIFDSFGYITGCTEGDATSISSDFIFHDELDLSPMDMISLFQSRLQNSEMKMTQSFSTPSFLDYGINAEYQRSDQREYMIKCRCCNHWQIPDFKMQFLNFGDQYVEVEDPIMFTPEQISELDTKSVYVQCENCKNPLDLNDSTAREWVARYPTRTNARGYKVRPMSTHRIGIPYILTQLGKYRQQDYMRGFFNTVLGEPFTSSSAQLQRDEIERVMSPIGNIPDVSKDEPVFLGLDMGAICHLTLLRDRADGKMEFVLFEQIPIFMLSERLREIRKTYSIIQGCTDRYPYTPTVDALRDETSGILMPLHYGGKAPIAPARDELGSVNYYTANRTTALDRVRTVIVHEDVVLSGYGSYRETIISHLRDMVRDDQPEREAEWKKLNQNDHFFHSMALALLARRVCEHVYSNAGTGLMSNVLISGMSLPGSGEGLNNNQGAHKVSRLGRMLG